MSYLKVRPIELDVSLVWAEAADRDGNVLRWGPDFGDTGFTDAARLRIVQVERIVATEALHAAPDRVDPWQADVVVAAPLGTYPFTSSVLNDDTEWLASYVAAMARLHQSGVWADVRPALDTLLRLNGDDDAFLASIGLPRLRALLA